MAPKDPSTPGPATVAAAHVSAEIAPDTGTDTDLDAGLAVIKQAGGLQEFSHAQLAALHEAVVAIPDHRGCG